MRFFWSYYSLCFLATISESKLNVCVVFKCNSGSRPNTFLRTGYPGQLFAYLSLEILTKTADINETKRKSPVRPLKRYVVCVIQYVFIWGRVENKFGRNARYGRRGDDEFAVWKTIENRTSKTERKNLRPAYILHIFRGGGVKSWFRVLQYNSGRV